MPMLRNPVVMNVVCAFAAVVSALACAAPAVGQTPTHPALVYATLGGRDLVLDLYIPTTGRRPYPLVIWIHGGGWSGGNRASPASAQQLLSSGIAVASIEYRLTSQAGQWGTHPVTFPAQIHDVKGAVRWLRANADTYNLRVDRFASWGSSAGGHLSALLATSGGVAGLEGDVGGNLGFSSRVQAAADYFGPTDLLMMSVDVTTPPGTSLDHDAPGSAESRLLGWDDAGQGIGDIRANLNNPSAPYPALVALANSVNPVVHVDANDPPMFIGHGGSDTVVPLRQSQRLVDALAAVGVARTYMVNPTAGHGGLGTTITGATQEFLRAHLLSLCGSADFDGDGDAGTDSDIEAFFACLGGECCGDCGSADFNGDGDAGTDSDIEAFFRVVGGGNC
jgi:acetyl esterase/lipase